MLSRQNDDAEREPVKDAVNTEALTLLTNFHQKHNRPTTGYPLAIELAIVQSVPHACLWRVPRHWNFGSLLAGPLLWNAPPTWAADVIRNHIRPGGSEALTRRAGDGPKVREVCSNHRSKSATKTEIKTGHRPILARWKSSGACSDGRRGDCPNLPYDVMRRHWNDYDSLSVYIQAD